MAYADQSAGSGKFTSILLVVLIHVGIGAALILGLGYEAVERAVTTTLAIDVPIEDEPPPEPEEAPPPPEQIIDTPPPPPLAPPPPNTPPSQNTSRVIDEIPTTRTCPGYPGRQFPLGADCPEPPIETKTCQGFGNRQFRANEACPAPPAPPSRAEPSNNPGTWVRQSDYQRSWLDQNLEGSVGFSVTVGANGRVQGCSVTASSGHSELDNATCRLVTQRARFRPATQGGQPVAGSYANRVQWQIR